MKKVTSVDWKRYREITKNRPPSPILKIAVENNPYKKDVAYDLGCGAGVDARFLQKLGWDIRVIDKEKSAIDFLKKTYKLNAEVNSLEYVKVEKAALINGSFAFPFCDPRAFPKFWRHITGQLKPGGTLSGQFFGKEDTWASHPNMTTHSHADCIRAFKGFDIVFFDELSFAGQTALGHEKHWHFYHFVLQKNG